MAKKGEGFGEFKQKTFGRVSGLGRCSVGWFGEGEVCSITFSESPAVSATKRRNCNRHARRYMSW